MKHLNRLWVFALTSLAFQAIAQTSTLVYENVNGNLAYGTYANQGQANAVNTVPDFSNTGYKGGGVPIPFIPTVVTVNAPSGGDDTSLIQNAIDAVAAMPLQINGFRGAVLIKAGNYQVANALNLNQSGIVIRGEGSQNTGGTQITMTATIQATLFQATGGGYSPSLVSGSTKTITDAFVPVGAKSFNVDSTAGYSVGDKIQIQYNINDLWIQDLGMNQLNAADPAATDWTAAEYQLLYERVVTAINGNTVTFDSPLVQAIENQYGGAKVSRYTFSGKISNIGFENLRLESTYTSDEDENHGWVGIQFTRVQDAWMRQVTGQYFGFGLVNITGYSHHITIEDCAMLDPKSITTGGRKYSFNLGNASHVMMQRCYTRGGRHDYVSGAKTPGPNVFVDCLAENTFSDAGPHHRYATGQLYDNVKCGSLNVHNRFTSGSGHGWSGAQVMFWNCVAAGIICDAPKAAMNWSVGCVAAHDPSWGKVEPNGIWQSHNTHVTPRSLYYRQLQERLGQTALRNVIIPEQESGPIWTSLSTWAGEGRFSNGVIAWASDALPSIPNDTITLTGRIRNFEILERGATTNWSKVSGPGSITFGGVSQLETTATFSAPGIYVMRLTVNDGVTTATFDLTVRYGNTAPVTDAGEERLIVISPSDPWIPTDLSPAAWYDASDAATVTASGGAVSQWNDKSGNNNHASQATAGNRPTNNNATIGGLAAISFRVANQQHLSAANHASLRLDGLGGANVFAVMNYKSYVSQGSSLNAALGKGQLLSASSSYGIRLSSSSQLGYQGGANAQAISSNFSNQNLLYGGIGNVTGKTSTLYVNGVEKITVTSATNVTSDNNDPLYIGRDPSSSRYADVDFGEIVIAGGVITISDRQKIEGYLAHKWGLEANLSAGHPYQSSSPDNASVTISLDGTTSDGDGDPITRTWSVFSGPAPVTFGAASAADTTAMFTAAGTYILRLTVNDGFETTTDDVVVTILENSPYNTWVADTFTDSSVDTALIGDPDGDSWINLQEFAFGMNPSSPTTQALTYTPGGEISSPGPPVIVNFAAAGQINDFRAVFVRRKNRLSAGLSYTVHFSADLGLWTTSATTPTVLSNDPGDLEVVSVPYPASVPLQSGGSKMPGFFRVGVSSN